MKTLYLVRHAKSSWKHPELSDFERPLNKRGQRDAPLMGKILRDKGVRPDILLSSPAYRAASTARIIAEQLNIPSENIRYNDKIYEATIQILYEIIKGFDKEALSAMLVGHNPEMTFFVNSISKQTITNMPTCGIAAVRFDMPKWSEIDVGGGQLIFYEIPKHQDS